MLRDKSDINSYKSSPYKNQFGSVYSPYDYQVHIKTEGENTIIETLPRKAKILKMSYAKSKNIDVNSTQYGTWIASKRVELSKAYFYLWLFFCTMIGFSVVFFLLMNNYSTKFAFPSMTMINDNIYSPTSLLRLPEEVANDGDVMQNFSEVQLTTYTLKSGDFLLNVAKEYNVTIDSIISWNNIQDARRVRAGDDIIIPNRSGVLHVVKRGESIESIGNKYNIKSTSILDANNLQSSVITAGAKLFLPDARMNKFQLDLVLGNVFLSPARGYISSGYGYRTSPISGKWMFHGAIDIANSLGSGIYAATYGTVTHVAYGNPTYGNMIVMTHPGGFQTLYAHLSKIYVKKGQRIERGRTIGAMGSTGQSTDSHLHFVLIHNGKTINPLRYIRVFR